MGIEGVVFIVWAVGCAMVIYWALRIGNGEPPGLLRVFIVWLITFVLFFGANLASPKIEYVSEEAARASFVLGTLPQVCLVMIVGCLLVALVTASIRRLSSAILLPTLMALWAGLYWLYVLISFHAEFSH